MIILNYPLKKSISIYFNDILNHYTSKFSDDTHLWPEIDWLMKVYCLKFSHSSFSFMYTSLQFQIIFTSLFNKLPMYVKHITYNGCRWQLRKIRKCHFYKILQQKRMAFHHLNGMQVSFGFVWALFYNISTLWCYSMLNPVYIYIYIYMIGKFVGNIFKWARTYLFTHS